MGLDNFASRESDDLVLSEDDEKAFEEVGIEFYSGMSSFFQGRVYSALVGEVTNESLYSSWLSPETVKKMSEALSKHTPSELLSINRRVNAYDKLTVKDMAGLQSFFRVCAERGLGIIGWS